MKINISILTMAFISLIGCGTVTKENNKKQATAVIESKSKAPREIILPEKEEGILKTSMIASEIQFIPLETNSKSIIGRGVRVKMNDSLIIISDREKILLFSKEGKFIRQIGKRGNGPGEYPMVFNFEFKNDTIYLPPVGKRSIIKYTLDGKFQKEIKVYKEIIDFSITPNGHIAEYYQTTGELTLFGPSMKPIRVFKPGNLTRLPGSYTIGDTFDTYFQKNGNKLLFTNYFCDTVWNISNGQLKADYIFNLKDKLLPYNILQDCYQSQDFDKFMKRAAKFHKINLLEGKNQLFIFQKTWVDNDLNAIYTHDFATEVTKKYTGQFIYDDMLSGMNLRIKSKNQCSEKVLISFVNPIKLVEELEEADLKDKPKAYGAWKEQMSKVKFDDNPVLAIIKLK